MSEIDEPIFAELGRYWADHTFLEFILRTLYVRHVAPDVDGVEHRTLVSDFEEVPTRVLVNALSGLFTGPDIADLGSCLHRALNERNAIVHLGLLLVETEPDPVEAVWRTTLVGHRKGEPVRFTLSDIQEQRQQLRNTTQALMDILGGRGLLSALVTDPRLLTWAFNPSAVWTQPEAIPRIDAPEE